MVAQIAMSLLILFLLDEGYEYPDTITIAPRQALIAVAVPHATLRLNPLQVSRYQQSHGIKLK